MTSSFFDSLGALVQADGVLFRLWAPNASSVDLVLENDATTHPLASVGNGYFEGFVADLGAGARYRFRKDGADLFPIHLRQREFIRIDRSRVVVGGQAYCASIGRAHAYAPMDLM